MYGIREIERPSCNNNTIGVVEHRTVSYLKVLGTMPYRGWELGSHHAT